MAIRPAGAGEILAGPYPATVLEVVDGDTLRVRVEVWIGQSLEVLARIRGIDAPELRARCDAERAMALAARAALAAAVPEGAVTLVAVEGDKYFGRVVADVSTPAGIDLAALMRTNGHARPYDGEARAGWCADAAVAAGPAAP